jgi:hypothetical protein
VIASIRTRSRRCRSARSRILCRERRRRHGDELSGLHLKQGHRPIMSSTNGYQPMHPALTAFGSAGVRFLPPVLLTDSHHVRNCLTRRKPRLLVRGTPNLSAERAQPAHDLRSGRGISNSAMRAPGVNHRHADVPWSRKGARALRAGHEYEHPHGGPPIASYSRYRGDGRSYIGLAFSHGLPVTALGPALRAPRRSSWSRRQESTGCPAAER